jgi:hypothetical protein
MLTENFTMANDTVKHSEVIALLFVLLFLTTPAFGLIYSFTGTHIANDKLAFLLGLYVILRYKISLWRTGVYISLILSSSIFLATLARINSAETLFFDQDISNLFWCFSFPIYASIFIKYQYSKAAEDALLYLTYFHLITFYLAVLAKFYGVDNVESYFISNPIQGDYRYPETCCGLYRVAGFFNESSQIGIYFVLMFWNYRESKCLPMALTFANILTFSMTSYLMQLILLLSNRRNLIYFALISVVLSVIFSDVLLAAISSIAYRWELFLSYFLGNGVAEPRLVALDENFQRFLSAPLSGIGASMADMDRWDVFSVYILPYGAFFGFLWIFALLYIFRRFKLGFFYYVVLATNATVLSYVTTVALFVAIQRKEKK